MWHKLWHGTPLILTVLVTLLAVAAVACGEEATPTPGPTPLPGEGKTLTLGHDGVTENVFQVIIPAILAEELGYQWTEPVSLDVPSINLAVASGDVTYNAIYWTPLQDDIYKDAGGGVDMIKVGYITRGALQGYLVDKKSADQYNITNLGQLKDPEIAKIFDTDGNGKADLWGCNPGWGCNRTIEHHMDAYELRDTVEHHTAGYFAQIAQVIKRVSQGKPVAYYTWTPLWLHNELVWGEDVEWLQVPFSAHPVTGSEDTSLPDGRNLGFHVNDVALAVNKRWAEENPAAAKLFSLVEIPINDINKQTAKMRAGEDRFDDMEGHAREWIQGHRDLADQWVAEAMAAAP